MVSACCNVACWIRWTPHEIVLPRAWAARATLMLLLAAQALERVEPPPSLVVPVTLAGTLAFWAGLTAGWILWGLEPLEGDTHA